MSITAKSPSSVESLYCEHHLWLLRWLNAKLGCIENAADLAQDTFVRLLHAQQNESAALDLEEPRAYLTVVAKRLMLNQFRRQSLEKTYLELLANLPEEHSPSAEHKYLILNALHEVDEMLDSLPEQVRRAFLLSQLEGLTYQQIADQLGVSSRTVKRYMARAYEACLLLML